ncbi:DNA/RNA helicase [Paenibacillus spiritus]|uniref:DNA/RNA helicase n=1 Tax=Paenibacillus spiritus TaxID=2496557 RepID=A0A5J5FW32_9BACL|nr:helicase-related protein [Paenibacillus spiritus]KAA8997992.1 DNA/RNA helicase [Paenibacillus spiritus]
MKAGVYAVMDKREWRLRLTVDWRVDQWWWSGQGLAGPEPYPGRPVLLHPALPLSWASEALRRFRPEPDMQRWDRDRWREHFSVLMKEISGGRHGTPGSSGVKPGGWPECGGGEEPQLPSAAALLDSAGRLAGLLKGRSLLAEEAEALLAEQAPELLAAPWRSAAQLAYLQGRLDLQAAVQPRSSGARPGTLRAGLRRRLLPRRALSAADGPRCLRCGSAAEGRTACAACGLDGCAYCEACLALGRSRSCALLLRSAPPGPAVRGTAAGGAPAAQRWGLSAPQARAAEAALAAMAAGRERPPLGRGAAAQGPAGPRPDKPPGRFLLWAVTGAGKTEMLFPLLDSVLAAGGRVLVATPRRDVVLELAPRLARAFPEYSRAVLYGGSADRWREASLTVATTHQLLRFYRAFDLVIIDELDAFPYHNDPMLSYAAESSCRPGGFFLYLSATPPAGLRADVRQGRAGAARVPVRYHGHPLPVPRRIAMPGLSQCLKRGSLPSRLREELLHSVERGAQVFVFVPRIADIEPLLALVRRILPDSVPAKGTSSRDPDRNETVEAFRKREIRVLLTTTILERGVTVPGSDVYILDADNPLFDEAALIQMAGRAGRSKEDPNGCVRYAAVSWTRAQRNACREIRTMNRVARRSGYLAAHRKGGVR